jgi:hypothetical protein
MRPFMTEEAWSVAGNNGYDHQLQQRGACVYSSGRLRHVDRAGVGVKRRPRPGMNYAAITLPAAPAAGPAWLRGLARRLPLELTSHIPEPQCR